MPKKLTAAEYDIAHPDGTITHVLETTRDFGPLHPEVQDMIDAILAQDLRAVSGALTPAQVLTVVAKFVIDNAVERARQLGLDPDEEWEMVFSTLESAVWKASDVHGLWKAAVERGAEVN